MEYRYLGNTGIKVSVISLGTVAFTDFEKEEEYYKIFKRAIDLGVNFIDTAEVYGENRTEEIVGRMIKKSGVRREELVVCTKLFIGKSIESKSINENGLSRKHLIEGSANSLKRLQLDYVDVILAHRPDPDTPIEETCRAFNWLIDQGRCFYWGTSEWTTEQIFRAIGICDKLKLIRPILEQPQYNFLCRSKVEKDYLRLYEENGHGITVWGPMAGGLLTGKYNDGIPADTKFADMLIGKITYYDPYMSTEEKRADTVGKINALAQLASTIGATLPQFCLAWVMSNKHVSTLMMGASKPEQFDDNIKAIGLAHLVTDEIKKKADEILGNKPILDMNFRTYSSGQPIQANK